MAEPCSARRAAPLSASIARSSNNRADNRQDPSRTDVRERGLRRGSCTTGSCCRTRARCRAQMRQRALTEAMDQLPLLRRREPAPICLEIDPQQQPRAKGLRQRSRDLEPVLGQRETNPQWRGHATYRPPRPVSAVAADSHERALTRRKVADQLLEHGVNGVRVLPGVCHDSRIHRSQAQEPRRDDSPDRRRPDRQRRCLRTPSGVAGGNCPPPSANDQNCRQRHREQGRGDRPQRAHCPIQPLKSADRSQPSAPRAAACCQRLARRSSGSGAGRCAERGIPPAREPSRRTCVFVGLNRGRQTAGGVARDWQARRCVPCASLRIVAGKRTGIAMT